MVIEVFKTNIADEKQASEVKHLLLSHFPTSRINFDLQDCDKVLRVEGSGFSTAHIIKLVSRKGVVCITLD